MGRPAFVQAGGSPRGRAFAAKHADSIIATANHVEGLRQYRDEVRSHAAAAGRNPDDIKVLYLVYPILGETTGEAKAKHQRMVDAPSFIEAALASVGSITDIDFSQYDLDAPLPHIPPMASKARSTSLRNGAAARRCVNLPRSALTADST